MAQQPSVPPHVSFQSGMLTIVAENSTLGDILREVHKSTGAAIEVPPNATERVVAHIGPGPSRDVLASLLNGTTFNYVMVGSTEDPTTIATVMLTTKSGGAAPASPEVAANGYQPPPQQFINQQSLIQPGQGPGGPVAQPATDDESADAETDKDEEDTADEEQPQGQAQNGAVPVQDGSTPNAGPKTPEQILEMLRQRPGQAVQGQPVMRPPNQPNQDDNSDNNNNN
jgi:hypothetical protein